MPATRKPSSCPWQAWPAALRTKSWRNSASPRPGGKTLLSQLVDADGDFRYDLLVFQAPFAPSQVREFTLSTCKREKYKREDFRVFGRFVRERHDDFAWENDKVAFRTYGPGLETWVKEPLTSSTIDAWSKGTTRLTINDWYMVDDYHKDHGEGGDFYSAGASRGCGGSGLVAGGKLRVSRNFRESRVIASGPIRLVFELSYPLWQDGFAATEKKRVTLDAGSRFNRFDSVFEGKDAAAAQPAAGIRIAKGAASRVERERGFVRTWEIQSNYGDGGWLGCAVVADPRPGQRRGGTGRQPRGHPEASGLDGHLVRRHRLVPRRHSRQPRPGTSTSRRSRSASRHR